ncbi:hypothetical protein NW853_10780, partial [Synechococcus sp. H55.11]
GQRSWKKSLAARARCLPRLLSSHRLLHGIPGLILPQVAVGGNSVWHQYTVRVPGSDPTDSRRRQLQERVAAATAEILTKQTCP